MKFFTADTHFNHTNIIKYCNRPFSSIEEMNNILILNWNNKVSKEDVIYILGDFGFGNVEPILKQLNGTKILIEGSHDGNNIKKYYKYFAKVSPLIEIHEQNQTIILCHYCIRTWAKSHHNSWHLYGHSHGKLKPIGKAWDVGVDNNNFMPLSFNEIVEIMKNRPDNPNLIENKWEQK